jgi:hypothetical protein
VHPLGRQEDRCGGARLGKLSQTRSLFERHVQNGVLRQNSPLQHIALLVSPFERIEHEAVLRLSKNEVRSKPGEGGGVPSSRLMAGRRTSATGSGVAKAAG